MHLAGIAFFAVVCHVGQHHAVFVFGFHGGAFEPLFVKAFQTAVERVVAIVLEQGVFGAVQGEAGTADAVAVAAYDGAQIGGLFIVFLQGVKTQHHVFHFAVLVRHGNGHQMCAEIQHGSGGAVFVGHGVQRHFAADQVHAKGLFLNAHGRSSFLMKNGETVLFPH